MGRLTHKGPSGYWSRANKYALTMELGLYEDATEKRGEALTELAETMCDNYCHWPLVLDQEKLDEKCEECKLLELMKDIV